MGSLSLSFQKYKSVAQVRWASAAERVLSTIARTPQILSFLCSHINWTEDVSTLTQAFFRNSPVATQQLILQAPSRISILSMDSIYSDVDSETFVEDMRDYGVKQALPLQDEGIDEDAVRYLRYVREEAARIPPVCTAVRREVVASKSEFEHVAPEKIHLSVQWMCGVLDNFVVARQQVVLDAEAGTKASTSGQLPNLADRRRWHRLLHHNELQPCSAVLASMDNNLVVSCLKDLMIEAFEASGPLLNHIGCWIYALMVRLEKPVHPDVASVLCQVSVLTRRQHFLGRAGVEQLAMYDTLLVIAGGFFGQDSYLGPAADKHLSSLVLAHG